MHLCGASRDARNYRFGARGGSKEDGPAVGCTAGRGGAGCAAMPFNKAEPQRARPAPPSAPPTPPSAASASPHAWPIFPPVTSRPRRFARGAVRTADRLRAHAVVAVVLLAIGFLVPAAIGTDRLTAGFPELTATVADPTASPRAGTLGASTRRPTPTASPSPKPTATPGPTPPAATATPASVVAAPPPPAAPPAQPATPPPAETTTPEPTALPSDTPPPTPVPTPPPTPVPSETPAPTPEPAPTP